MDDEDDLDRLALESSVHFDGDPAVDSRRRHLERLLEGRPRKRWWIAAIFAGAGAWALWRLTHPRPPDVSDRQPSAPAEPAPSSTSARER